MKIEDTTLSVPIKKDPLSRDSGTVQILFIKGDIYKLFWKLGIEENNQIGCSTNLPRSLIFWTPQDQKSSGERTLYLE